MIKPRKTLGIPGVPARWNDWPAWMHYNIAYAKTVVQKDDELHGALFGFHTRRGVSVLWVGFLSDDQKAAAYKFLTLYALATEAEAVAFISEAWTREMSRRVGETDAEFIERGKAVMPSQAEDRIEVLTSQMIYRDDGGDLRAYNAMVGMLRNDAGKISGFRSLLTEAEMAESAAVRHGEDGYLSEVLQPERPSEQQARMARTMLDHGVLEQMMRDLNIAEPKW